MIDNDIYFKFKNSSIVKTCINKRTGELHYELNSAHLIGSYSNSVNIRFGDGGVYGFKDKKYLSVEGSYHKLINGYNSHNGYYNLEEIVNFFVGAIEYDFKVKLPNITHWFLQRIDIAIVYDLGDNQKVRKYINNLSLCNYPRRNIKHYTDESIYTTGTTTTLKIYNKMLEFRKHDMKKLYNSNFNIDNYLNEIDGFVRFECEIKKKKLEDIYNKKYIRVKKVNYEDLRSVWSEEFMKLLKFFESDLTIVKNKDDIRNRILTCYGKVRGNNLYAFYSSLMLDGFNQVKNNTSKSTFYRKIKDLISVNIDISQKYKLDMKNEIVDFNPFEWKEVV